LKVDCRLPVRRILQILRDYRPDVMGGYSGAVCHVAEAAGELDRRLIRPRHVGVGAEVLTEAMRYRIQEAFGAPVHQGYGSHEFSLIAWECRETGEMHTCDDGVVVEVLVDGRPALPGERGEMIGTNLQSYAMPFIRYRLGDIITQGSPACACGLPFGTIRAVQGRVLDYLTLPDGRELHPYEITTLVVDDADWVARYQIIQERIDLLRLRIAPLRRPSLAEMDRLEAALRERLGLGVSSEIDLVDSIGPGPDGKFRVVRSEVSTQP
jgi:phenylacetate-CoA ligase